MVTLSFRIARSLFIACLFFFAFAGTVYASDGHGSGGVEVSRAGPEAGHLQETATSQDNPLTHHLIWEWAAFIILLVILGKFGFPWMFKQMDMRQARIKEALDKADKVKEGAEALLEKHEKMMAEAHAQAKSITDEAIKAGAKVREDIVEKAQKEANTVVERAKKEIGMAQTKAMDELRTAAVELSLQASSAVLGRSLTDDDHRRLASDAIAAASQSMSSN